MPSDSLHSIRAFVAIPLPPELRAQLTALQRDLQAGVGAEAVRWTRPDQIHLTLRFMSHVATEAMPELEEALRRACQGVASLRLRAEGVGCFPDAQRPRIIWVGIGGARDALQTLQASIERETRQWGEPENRAFQPHLTIGRIKHAKRDAVRALARALTARSGAVLGEWLAQEVELIRSELSAEGPHHSRLSQLALV